MGIFMLARASDPKVEGTFELDPMPLILADAPFGEENGSPRPCDALEAFEENLGSSLRRFGHLPLGTNGGHPATWPQFRQSLHMDIWK
jgi:hypothetical protein